MCGSIFVRKKHISMCRVWRAAPPPPVFCPTQAGGTCTRGGWRRLGRRQGALWLQAAGRLAGEGAPGNSSLWPPPPPSLLPPSLPGPHPASSAPGPGFSYHWLSGLGQAPTPTSSEPRCGAGGGGGSATPSPAQDLTQPKAQAPRTSRLQLLTCVAGGTGPASEQLPLPRRGCQTCYHTCPGAPANLLGRSHPQPTPRWLGLSSHLGAPRQGGRQSCDLLPPDCGICPGGPPTPAEGGGSSTDPQVWELVRKGFWGDFLSPYFVHTAVGLGALCPPPPDPPRLRMGEGGPGSPAQPQEGTGRGCGEVIQTHPRGHLVGKGLLRFNHKVTAKQTQGGLGGRRSVPDRTTCKTEPSGHASSVHPEGNDTADARHTGTPTSGPFLAPNIKT